MEAPVHDITGHLKEHEMFYAKPGDFALGEPRLVSPKVVLDEPGWSPYCIDHTTGALAFVQLPEDVDLADAAFLYVTQYRKATRLLLMPLGDLAALASDLENPNVAFIFAMGRCGTTLASHALNGAPEAWSLSEPDVFNHRALQFPADATVTGGDMIRDVVRILYATRKRREKSTLAIKLRSQSLYHMRPFTTGRPDARYVFMYRDAISWAASVHQFMLDVNFKLPMTGDEQRRGWSFFTGDGPLEGLARYIEYPADSIEADAMLAAGWMAHLETYLQHVEAGVPFLALRYNELVADRRGEVAKLFAHCGLSDAGLDAALGAFDEDSQKDTVIGRRENRVRLTDENVANIRAILARNSRFSDPDLILPDSYSR